MMSLYLIGQKGFNTFLSGISNYIKEISDVSREKQMSKNPSTRKELSLEKEMESLLQRRNGIRINGNNERRGICNR